MRNNSKTVVLEVDPVQHVIERCFRLLLTPLKDSHFPYNLVKPQYHYLDVVWFTIVSPRPIIADATETSTQRYNVSGK